MNYMTRLSTPCTICGKSGRSIWRGTAIIDSGSPFTVLNIARLQASGESPTGDFYEGNYGGAFSIPRGCVIWYVYLDTPASAKTGMKIYGGDMGRIINESEVILGMNWLQAANPKINWINRVISPGSIIPNNGQVSTASRVSRPYSSLQAPFQQAVTSRRTESHHSRARSPARRRGSTRLDSSPRHALSPRRRAGSPFRRPNHPPWPIPPPPPNSSQRGRIVRRARSFETFLPSKSGEDDDDDGFYVRVRESLNREVGDIGRKLKRQRDEVFGRIRR